MNSLSGKLPIKLPDLLLRELVRHSTGFTYRILTAFFPAVHWHRLGASSFVFYSILPILEICKQRCREVECWLEKSKIVTKVVTSRPRNRVQVCVYLESCLPHSASYFGLVLGFYNDENFPNAGYMVGTSQTRYCKGSLRKTNESFNPHSA